MFFISFQKSNFFVIYKGNKKKNHVRHLDFSFKAFQISAFMLLNQNKNNYHTKQFANILINKTAKKSEGEKSKISRKLATGFF